MISIFQQSIRKSLILIVFISILPALGIIIYSSLERRNHQIEHAGYEVMRMAESAAEIQNRIAFSARQMLVSMAHTQEVLERDLEACTRLFRDMLTLNPGFYNIVVTDASGDILAAALPFASVNLSDRKHFRDARDSKSFSAGEFIETRIDPEPAFPYAYPVLDEKGDFKGIVAAVTSLRGYQNFFENIALPPGSFIGMTDHQGRRLFRVPADPEIFPLGVPIRPEVWQVLSGQEKQQSFVEHLSDKSLQVISYHKLQLSEDHSPYMYMVVGMPRSEVLAMSTYELSRYVALLLAAWFMAFGLAWLLGDLTIVKKFTRLQKVSDQLAKGDLSVRTGLEYSGGEIGRLARSFDSMAQQLAMDIARREKARDELRASEEKYRILVNGLPDVIMLFDGQGRHLFVSEKVREVVDLDPGQFINKTHAELGFPEDQCKFWEEAIKKVFNIGLPLETEYTFEGKHGTTTHNWRLLPVKNPHGEVNLVFSISRDISAHKRAEQERDKLQAQLLQARKMESVGVLAGGIAHDFNNLLHVMGGNLELLDMKLAEDHPGKKRIPTIQKSMGRAAQLVRQMLQFSRKAEAKRQDMDLNQEIQHAAEMLERTIPKMVSIELDLDKEARFINADPIQVEQVLLNLATNAADAMPDGGRLIIETSNVDVDEALANEHTGLKKGEYVLMSVSDTGCGMDEETLDKVFDPFFTTKEVGKGTGLGLASVYGIVKAHEGYITCQSQPGKGTTFKIYWPAVNTKLGDD
jgi:PAS domain S-box-containing protein